MGAPGFGLVPAPDRLMGASFWERAIRPVPAWCPPVGANCEYDGNYHYDYDYDYGQNGDCYD
eukprot:5786753-Pyramimonas_sp.AAC.1